MFIGEYTHKLDKKRRVSVPKSFREEIGNTVVLTRGLDGCIFGFSEASWERISTKLSDLSFGDADARALNRFLFSGAREVELDSAGRVLVPDFLSAFAELEDEAVFAGLEDRLEIWNKSTWEDHKAQVEENADQLAQTLGDVGML